MSRREEIYVSVFWRVLILVLILGTVGYVSGALGAWAVAQGIWVSIGKAMIVAFIQAVLTAYTAWRIAVRVTR